MWYRYDRAAAADSRAGDSKHNKNLRVSMAFTRLSKAERDPSKKYLFQATLNVQSTSYG